MISQISLLSKLSPSGVQDAGPFGQVAKPATTDVGQTFAQMLGDAANSTVSSLQSADRLSVQAMKGEDISPREVVDAVMSAEQALQTSIAIRDKIVNAYLEISRMPI